MLDLQLFKIDRFLYGNLMGFFAYFSQTFAVFLTPFYLESLLHFSPAKSGMIMTIPPLVMAVTAPIAGNLSDKLGSARLTSTAFSLLMGAHLILSSFGISTDIYKICGGLALLGCGMGFFGSPNNSTILGSVPRKKAGYTGGFVSTVRNFSFSLGIASSVSIFTYLLVSFQQETSYASAYVLAHSFVFKISAFITFIGLVISLLSSKHTASKNKVTDFDPEV